MSYLMVIKAPQFTLPDENERLHSLSDYLGKKIVLYFYPKDETPTCTTQACDMRDNYALYQEKGIIIIGISSDSIESHKKFKDNHHLPFPLLADIDHAVAKAYGAFGGFFRLVGMPQRKTYLIDEQGNLVKKIDKVNVATQSADILAGFDL